MRWLAYDQTQSLYHDQWLMNSKLLALLINIHSQKGTKPIDPMDFMPVEKPSRPPPGFQVDHIDHDQLNNTRSNLRLCTNNENQLNKRPRKDFKASKYKGVGWNTNWRAKIHRDGKTYHLGYFDTEEEAAVT